MLLLITGVLVLTYIVWWRLRNREVELDLTGRHVLITGGSSGIGLAMAFEILRRHPARLTLVARNADRLEQARTKLLDSLNTTCDVRVIPLDVTDSFENIKTTLLVTHKVGAVDVLINCAGTAVAETFEGTSHDTFERLMRLNYLGPVHVTKALLPVMLPERSGATGRCIAFVSSAAAFVPVYGFTAYAASKAALAMFSNILQQELEDKKLSVTTVFPPDTDTPGLHAENVGKPKITEQISSAGGLESPEVVAARAIHDILIGRRRSFIGFVERLLGWATAGVSRIQQDCPVLLPPALVLMFEILLAPFLKTALIIFAYHCRRIIRLNDHHETEQKRGA